jgi:hypothetical protein
MRKQHEGREVLVAAREQDGTLCKIIAGSGVVRKITMNTYIRLQL